MKTAVIYARYSTDMQTEQSIEGKVHVCKEYAKMNDVYTEAAVLINDVHMELAIR